MFRAVEECFYAYRWALSNADKLGSTAARVVVVGDSAGGNLTLAVTLKCILEVCWPKGVFSRSDLTLNFSPEN